MPPALDSTVSNLITALLGALASYRGPANDGLAQARSLKDLRTQILRALERRAPLTLTIGLDGLWLEQRPIRREDPRTAALARALYQDGVRQLELGSTIGERDVIACVEAVLASLRSHPDGEDFISCLWRHDAPGLRTIVADGNTEVDAVEALLTELEEHTSGFGQVVPLRAVDPRIPGLDLLRAEGQRERAQGLEARVLFAAMEQFLAAEGSPTAAAGQAALIELLDGAIAQRRWDRALRIVGAVLLCGTASSGADAPAGGFTPPITGRTAAEAWLEKVATPTRLRELVLVGDAKASSIIAALGKSAAPGLVALMPALEGAGPRKLVIELLASLPGWDLSLLEPVVRTERPSVALDGIEILARARRPASFAVMAEGYRHPSPAVRAALADALGQFQHERSFALACQLLEDLDPKVRTAAARTLGRSGQRDAARHLERAMQAPVFDAEWPEVKEAIVGSYVRLEGPRAVQWLRTLYHSRTGLLPRKDRDETAEIVLRGLRHLGAEAGSRRSRAN